APARKIVHSLLGETFSRGNLSSRRHRAVAASRLRQPARCSLTLEGNPAVYCAADPEELTVRRNHPVNATAGAWIPNEAFMREPSNRPKTEAASAASVYYREYKLLLRSDLFVKPAHFHKYWKVTRRVAKSLGIAIRKRGKPMETHLREVLFFDTPRFRLYNNGFILRRRTFYRKGLPETNHEITVK